MILSKKDVVLDVDMICKEADDFCKENELSGQLCKEVMFMCKAFALYFNNCQKSKNKYEFNILVESFESNVTIQAESLGTGLKPLSKNLYKIVPSIKAIFDEDTKGGQSVKEKELDAKLSKLGSLEEYERRLKNREKGIKAAEAKVKQIEEEAKQEIRRAKSGYYNSSYSPGRC